MSKICLWLRGATASFVPPFFPPRWNFATGKIEALPPVFPGAGLALSRRGHSTRGELDTRLCVKTRHVFRRFSPSSGRVCSTTSSVSSIFPSRKRRYAINAVPFTSVIASHSSLRRDVISPPRAPDICVTYGVASRVRHSASSNSPPFLSPPLLFSTSVALSFLLLPSSLSPFYPASPFSLRSIDVRFFFFFFFFHLLLRSVCTPFSPFTPLPLSPLFFVGQETFQYFSVLCLFSVSFFPPLSFFFLFSPFIAFPSYFPPWLAFNPLDQFFSIHPRAPIFSRLFSTAVVPLDIVLRNFSGVDSDAESRCSWPRRDKCARDSRETGESSRE